MTFSNSGDSILGMLERLELGYIRGKLSFISTLQSPVQHQFIALQLIKQLIELANKEIMAPRRHICSICNAPRSRDFHRRHPLKPGDRPIPGVCRRCLPCKVDTLVIEIHHHYPAPPSEDNRAPTMDDGPKFPRIQASELPADERLPPYPELPAESLDGPTYGQFYKEELPPPVRYDKKPKGSWHSKFQFSQG